MTLSRLECARQALAQAESQVGVKRPLQLGKATQVAQKVTVSQLGEILSSLMGQNQWAAVVALPDLGWLRLHQEGVDLSRIIFIPQVNNIPEVVLAACVDGVLVTVCGEVPLSANRRTALAGRARARGHFLVWVARQAQVGSATGLEAVG